MTKSDGKGGLLKKIWIVLCVCVVGAVSAAKPEQEANWEVGFENASLETAPWVYWRWVWSYADRWSKVGITAELEAMKAQGIGGVTPLPKSGLLGPIVLRELSRSQIGCSYAGVASAGADALRASEIRQLMNRVNQYQIDHPVAEKGGGVRGESNRPVSVPETRGWTRAVWYHGVGAAYRATGDEEYLRQMLRWGQHHKWKSGHDVTPVKNVANSPNHLFSAQTWLECFFAKTDPQMIAALTGWLESKTAGTPSGAKVWYTDHTGYRYVDSLYGAPALAMLAKATRNPQYLTWLNDFFWDVRSELYDPDEHLFYRDRRFINQRNKNGNKVLWSRGNGWAMAGTFRILENLPVDAPGRDKFVQLFQEMARSLIQRQGDDGLWRTNLADVNEYPMPESSGSGFFCYALAGGVRLGVLDAAEYLPAARKAWAGLVNCVSPEGRVGYGQIEADHPFEVRPEDTHEYVTGAFLLAASEMYRLSQAAMLDVNSSSVAADGITRTLRHRYMTYLTGGESVNRNDPDVEVWLRDNEAEAMAAWKAMDRTPGAKMPWSDLRGGGWGSTLFFRRTVTMATAYRTPGSGLYNNQDLKQDILTAMRLLLDNSFGQKEEPGNWWDWMIGTPIEAGKCLTLMDNDLGPELRDGYLAAFRLHVLVGSGQFTIPPRVAGGFRYPIHHGVLQDGPGCSNMGCMLFRTFVEGCLAGDELTVKQVMQSIQDRWLQYSDTGGLAKRGKGGFYPDGSYIYHGVHPYIGSYGLFPLEFLTKAAYIAEGTAYALDPEAKRRLVKICMEALAPFIYKGAMMDTVRGRAMSREFEEGDHCIGHVAIRCIYLVAQIAPDPEDAIRLKRLVKYWVQTDSFRNFYRGQNTLCNNNDLFFVAGIKKLMQDTRISPADEPVGHHRFPIMDRVVHLRPGFGFAVAMHDNIRIANGEVCGENPRGHRMSDGMTYIYNNDLGQFSDNYWPTIDPLRLPGITVRRKPLNRPKPHAITFNGSNWVGGVDIDRLYGIAGMELMPDQPGPFGSQENTFEQNKTFRAKKSWFMFDDEVVALGSDISAKDGATVETIVDNRKLANVDSARITVDGRALLPRKEQRTLQGIMWMHLDSGIAGAGIGYWFPGGADITELRERRTGNWNHLSGFTRRQTHIYSIVNWRSACQADYQAFWFDHGVDPQKASYAYVLLPGKTPTEVNQYAQRPQVVILENSAEAQGVQETMLNITGVNFWNDAVKKVAFITVDRKASVMVRESQGRLDVAISDPTQVNEGRINLELDREADSVIAGDDHIEITQLRPTLKLSVKVKGRCGATCGATFRLRTIQ